MNILSMDSLGLDGSVFKALVGDFEHYPIPFEARLFVEPFSGIDLRVKLRLEYTQGTSWRKYAKKILSMYSFLSFEDPELSGDLESKLITEFLLLTQELAPRVYGMDPRIGFPKTQNFESLKFPMFDRPDGQTGLKGVDGELLCSQCRQIFREGPQASPPIWGGGNFLWVHEACFKR